MKCGFDWFIIGLIVFWIIETLAFITNVQTRTYPYIEFLIPLFMWLGGLFVSFSRGKK
jgi:hypothetical protein